MSTTFGPPVVLAGPLPASYPYGLLSAARIVDGEEPRWGNGANVRPFPAGTPGVFDPCSTGTFRDKDIPDQPDAALFSAFTVYLADQCFARGVGTDEDLADRARLAFQASEQFAVENELATGDLMPSNPYLGDSNADVLASGAAVGRLEGLALLEGAIGASGRAGVIHADRATASAWSHHGALRVVGQQLLTYLGTPVAAGGGYAGVQPDGESAAGADQGWAFATGPVEVRRSDTIEIIPGSLAEALDRSTNMVTYFAERDYLVTWDTQLQAAVLVDRSS